MAQGHVNLTQTMAYARKSAPQHVNDMRKVTQQNARIKAELNEQAHGARMSEFEALLHRLKELSAVEVVEQTLYKGNAISTAGVLRTEAEAKLRGYVTSMSRRIKLR